MRTLHGVAAHEKLLARGLYRVLRDGQETGKVEHWNLHRLPDGGSVLRADVDGREATDNIGTESVLVHLLRGPSGEADRLHVRYENGGNKAEAQLTFFPDHAIVSHLVDGHTRPRSEIDLPENVMVVAPCLASHPAIAYDADAKGRQVVSTLELNMDQSAGKLLAPQMREISLTYEGMESVNLNGVGVLEARHVVVDDSTDVEVDVHNTVLRVVERREPDASIAVLGQYTRFDDPVA